MPLGLSINHDHLVLLCRRYHVASLELFGSRAKGTAVADSDVDLLVTFEKGYIPGLEFFGMADQFTAIFGHPVDLFTREPIE